MKRIKRVIMKLANFVPDKPYLYALYFMRRKELPNLKNPRSYSEKINWLKLYGQLERYSKYADKFTVRDYVANKIGEQHLIPLLGVWDTFADVPFDKLPKRFALKATHGCGYNYICADKSAIDLTALETMAKGWLEENFYRLEREPQYKFCTPRLIAEQYLEDDEGELRDYKFTCVNGDPKIIQVDVDRFTAHKSYMLNPGWTPLGYASSATYPGVGLPGKRPDNLNDLLEIARKLSEDFYFVRVDLYSIGDKIYFGELTFTPSSGFAKFTPKNADVELGKLLDLSRYRRGADSAAQ